MPKKNFDFDLLDIDGAPLKEGEKVIQARTIVVNALMSNNPQEAIGGEEKARRYGLGILANKGGELDLTPEDIALLKDLIGKFYAPIIVGQIYQYLNA